MTDRAEWRRRILEDLGGEGVDPDLTEAQLDAAIQRGLECWNKYRPCTRWYPFDLPAAETTRTDFFAQPEQAFVRGVLEVQFTDRNRRILGPRAGFLEGYYLRWGYQGPRLFAQLHAGERTYERLTGSRPDWRWDPESRVLFFSNPSRDLRAMVLVAWERRPEDIPYHHETDFRRLIVASAKRTLARVLGARGPYPGAAGNIETDALLLREEADREWKETEDRIATALISVAPPGYIG